MNTDIHGIGLCLIYFSYVLAKRLRKLRKLTRIQLSLRLSIRIDFK